MEYNSDPLTIAVITFVYFDTSIPRISSFTPEGLEVHSQGASAPGKRGQIEGPAPTGRRLIARESRPFQGPHLAMDVHPSGVKN